MLSDFPDQTLPATPLEKSKDGEQPRGLPSDKWVTRPPIQAHIMRWIISQGLSQSAAEAITLSFYDMVVKKAKEEGERKAAVTYDVGYEHEHIKIGISQDKEHDPEDLLAKYLFDKDIKGDWEVVERIKRSGRYIYLCKRTAKETLTAGKGKAAMKAVDKLSKKQAAAMLEALQAMLASQKET